MRQKSGIKRLLALYEIVEKSRSLELRIAVSAVAEVEQAWNGEEGALAGYRECEVKALKTADPAERMIAQACRDTSLMRLDGLMQIYADREKSHQIAQVLHSESRLMKERIERVTERERLSTEAERARRTQAESDDRYASRHGWNLSQATQVVTSDAMKAT